MIDSFKIKFCLDTDRRKKGTYTKAGEGLAGSSSGVDGRGHQEVDCNDGLQRE